MRTGTAWGRAVIRNSSRVIPSSESSKTEHTKGTTLA